MNIMKRSTYLSAIVFATAILLAPISNMSAQDEKESPISIGADVMSRYVWRGTDYGASPSIQPYIEASFGGFAIGAWGAYATNLPGVQEMDLYASYTFLDDMLTVGITDYFFPDEVNGYDYFEWNDSITGHVLEGMIGFNGLEDLPLSAMFAYNFYGADTQNSLYIELGYSFSIFDIFLGMGNGFYTSTDKDNGDDKFGLVNLGISATKEIPITDKYGIPISASLITNPNDKLIHLVFGISF
jgi:hypothetical protein